MRQVVPRLVVVIGLLVLVSPKPTSLDIQRWLDKGDEASKNQDVNQANHYYERAEKRDTLAESSANDSFIAASTENSTNPNDALVMLINEHEQNEWTDETRQQYAVYRQALGSSQAMLALFEVNPTALGSDTIPLLRELADAEIAQQNWEAAVEYLEALLLLQPNDSRTNYLLGLITLTEDTRRAFTYFNTIGSDPEINQAVESLSRVAVAFNEPVTYSDYQSLGLTLIDLEEWVFAERAFNAAIALEQDWLSFTYRGYVRDHIEGDSGFKDFGSALALAPTSPLVYYFLGLHWRQADDLATSHEAFLNAYFLETTNPAYAIEIGRTNLLMGDNISAEEWFNIAVSLEPDNLQWHQLRAAFYADEGFALESDGIAAIQEDYTFAPEDPDILTSLGYAHLQLENVDDAQNFLELAINIDPNSARTQYIYGLTMQEQEDTETAINAFLRAVEIEGELTGYGLLSARILEQFNITLP